MQAGNGISRSMEMMSQAIMAQVMSNSQARGPFHQNLFYQQPEMSHAHTPVFNNGMCARNRPFHGNPNNE